MQELSFIELSERISAITEEDAMYNEGQLIDLG